ncbi:MAG: nucleotidyltransferase family protein [Terriglobia bacterium]
MNRALAAEVVNCLSVAGSSQDRVQQLTRFSPREWNRSLNWMDLSGIALAFWDRLQKLKAEDAVPPQVGAALAMRLADHRLRVAGMAREFDSLNRQFERAGIDYAVLKGFSLIPEYCPDACLRPSYDYDYLVSEDDRDRAQEVVQAAGYVRKSYPGRQHHDTFKLQNLPSRLAILPRGLYTAALPRRLELHVSLWDEEVFRIPLRVPQCPLERKSRRTWQGLSFYSLGEDDEFAFQALHTFRHILYNWCRLGWLLDLAYFLERRAMDSFFWRRVSAQIEVNEPLAGAVALVTLLARHIFHSPLPPPIEGQILAAMRARVSLWVDRYGLRSALDNFAENKYTLFLYQEFARDEGTWRQIRRSRLLPLHRPPRVTEAATPGNSRLLPGSWRQVWYVVQRLIHHSLTGPGYVWESARWERIKASADSRRNTSVVVARGIE